MFLRNVDELLPKHTVSITIISHSSILYFSVLSLWKENKLSCKFVIWKMPDISEKSVLLYLHGVNAPFFFCLVYSSSFNMKAIPSPKRLALSKPHYDTTQMTLFLIVTAVIKSDSSEWNVLRNYFIINVFLAFLVMSDPFNRKFALRLYYLKAVFGRTFMSVPILKFVHWKGVKRNALCVFVREAERDKEGRKLIKRALTLFNWAFLWSDQVKRIWRIMKPLQVAHAILGFLAVLLSALINTKLGALVCSDAFWLSPYIELVLHPLRIQKPMSLFFIEVFMLLTSSAFSCIRFQSYTLSNDTSRPNVTPFLPDNMPE